MGESGRGKVKEEDGRGRGERIVNVIHGRGEGGAEDLNPRHVSDSIIHVTSPC